MRPLTVDETRALFEKLAKYIGRNITHLIDRPDGEHCFRLHDARIFYVRSSLANVAQNIGRERLVALGTCIGKFTKGGAVRLHVTALDYLAQYAQYKIWIKPKGEMSFLYGNNVVKGHVQRITDDTPQHQEVVIFNAQNIPLGFGVTAKNSSDARRVDPTAVVAFHQADVGEYLRDEQVLI